MIGRVEERGRRAGVRGERRERGEGGREEGGRQERGEGRQERGKGAYCGMWNSPVTTLFRVLFTPSVCRERDFW